MLASRTNERIDAHLMHLLGQPEAALCSHTYVQASYFMYVVKSYARFLQHLTCAISLPDGEDVFQLSLHRLCHCEEIFGPR
ncbi:hypothetical protein BDZ89DRAFT_1057173 [Hymenopellis radicata]|nr:hypothetical protein BDZ89DRAFT_1057173 [Hymenopellis radicata]